MSLATIPTLSPVPTGNTLIVANVTVNVNAVSSAFGPMDDDGASSAGVRFGTDFRGRISRPEAELRNRKVAFPAVWKRKVRLALADVETTDGGPDWQAIGMGARAPGGKRETRPEWEREAIKDVKGVPQHALDATDLRSSRLTTATDATDADALRREFGAVMRETLQGVSRIHRPQIGARIVAATIKAATDARSVQIGRLCEASPTFKAFQARTRAARNLAKNMARLARKHGERFAPGIYGDVAVWRAATSIQRCPVAKRAMALALRHHWPDVAPYRVHAGHPIKRTGAV